MEVAYYPGCTLHASSEMYDIQGKLVFKQLFESLDDFEKIKLISMPGLTQTLDRLAAHLPQIDPYRRELTITRTFAAPRALVWRAWTDPKQLAKWWGPHGFSNPVCEIDLKQRRGQDDGVQPDLGMYAPELGTIDLAGRPIAGLPPEAVTQAGVGRSFQITNLFPTLSVVENVRLAVQARHRLRFDFWRPTGALADVDARTAEVLRTMGLAGVERAEAGSLSYGGQRLLDMALALCTQPRVLLLDEPLAGLAQAEREGVGRLIKDVSRDLPVLLVEHDIRGRRSRGALSPPAPRSRGRGGNG